MEDARTEIDRQVAQCRADLDHLDSQIKFVESEGAHGRNHTARAVLMARSSAANHRLCGLVAIREKLEA